jgi:hypothetical protein
VRRRVEITTWEQELQAEMRKRNDPGPVLFRAPNENDFNVTFCPGYGAEEGMPVLAWTEQRVYFPICYDGAEWMGSAPRNYQFEGQEHQGGG